MSKRRTDESLDSYRKRIKEESKRAKKGAGILVWTSKDRTTVGPDGSCWSGAIVQGTYNREEHGPIGKDI